MAPSANVSDAVNALGDALNDARAAVEHSLDRLDTVEWILLIIGATLLFGGLLLLFEDWRARRQQKLGPVLVKPFTCPPEHVEVGRLVARMEERLERSGLRPPSSVPEGSPEEDFIAVVASSPVPQAAFFAKLLTALNAARRRARISGYTISGALMVRPGPLKCGITLVTSTRKGGQTERIRTFWSRTFEEAVGLSAYDAFVWISRSTPADRRPYAWERWTHPTALARYQEGLDLERDGELSQARDFYSESAQEQTSCALPRLRYGNLCERLAMARAGAGEWNREVFVLLLDALTVYSECKELWPTELHEPRYRLAVICGFDRVWSRSWDALDASEKGPQLPRLKRFIGPFDGKHRGYEVAQTLMGRATGEWEELRRVLGSNQSKALRDSIEVAELCARLQVREATLEDLGRVFALTGGGASAAVRYNAACFFSLALRYRDGSPLQHLVDSVFVGPALEQLKQVITDPRAHASAGLIAEDPDLDPLRVWLRDDPLAMSDAYYGAWQHQLASLAAAE